MSIKLIRLSREAKMKTINVLFIHGIGGDKTHAHETMLKNLRAKLPKNLEITPFAVNYLSYSNYNQEENFQRMLGAENGKYMKRLKFVRKLFLSSFGDALGIYADRGIYNQVMENIDYGVRRLVKLNPKAPTIVISQSLGCQMFSCYMWDKQRNESINPKINMWFSTGNNMRGFFHSRNYLQVVPFDRPTPNFKWINFFSWSDLLLGYHMTGINKAYDRLLTQDVHVKGIPFLSHSRYDDSNKVIKTIVSELEKI